VPIRALWLVVGAVALGGCTPLGGAGAGASSTTGGGSTSVPPRVAGADTTHEVPAPAPPAEQPATGAAAPTGAGAVRAFATAYINWSAGSVQRDLRTLAADSVGQARSAMVLAAAQTAADYELHQGGIANTGTVEVVAPLPGRAGQYVVVTREATSAANTNAYAGLRAAWHVTLATVREARPGRWVVSGWQPES
jgi:hypothetical protein